MQKMFVAAALISAALTAGSAAAAPAASRLSASVENRLSLALTLVDRQDYPPPRQAKRNEYQGGRL
jgi:hypothetical protein